MSLPLKTKKKSSWRKDLEIVINHKFKVPLIILVGVSILTEWIGKTS